VTFLWLLLPARRDDPPSFPSPRPAKKWHVDPEKAHQQRDRALKQARTWHATDPHSADLSANPSDPSGLLSTDVVECRHLEKAAGGTSPKFDCVLADGEVVRVKYGLTKEINAEIAATRLLTALGFGTTAALLFVVAMFAGMWLARYITNRAALSDVVAPADRIGA